MSGYSGTPLIKKLGIKEGFRVKTINAPDSYLEWLCPLPDGVVFATNIRRGIDVCHLFTKSRKELVRSLEISKKQINQNGMIWVSWPKKSSGVQSEVTGDLIREVCLPMGLVDIKVCAVNDMWSGLKLVIRKELRK